MDFDHESWIWIGDWIKKAGLVVIVDRHPSLVWFMLALVFKTNDTILTAAD